MEGVFEMLRNNAKSLVRSSVICVALATLVASPAYACSPVGVINKSVEDLTTSSALEDANTTSAALRVNSGDTLEYVVTIRNNGTPESNGNNDMTKTVLTDNLPAGIELVNDPTMTTITENIGTVPAGSSVTKSYEVKVTSTQNGAYITNKACFTGNSVQYNNAQSGCDTAVVLVNVPTPIPTPVPTPTPTPTPVVTPPAPAPQTLVNTGPGNIVLPVVFVTILGYVLRLKRNAARQS
jgi:uncharacterized repeat protein (TIGR01451 family)